MSDLSLFGGTFWRKKPAAFHAPNGGPQGNTVSAASPATPPVADLEETFGLEDLIRETIEQPEEPVPALAMPPGRAPAMRPERRGKRRALISAPVRVRGMDLTRDGLNEIGTTLNASRLGILIETSEAAYVRGMDVMVAFPYSPSPAALPAEQPGRVVRIVEAGGGKRLVALALGVTHGGEEFVNAAGESVGGRRAPNFLAGLDPSSAKPLVLVLDAQHAARESLRNYLANEGYDAIAVAAIAEAREALEQCTPALLIAEIEGEGLPGFDICVYCKSTPRLRHVPVMLTTSSAYPTDYANAHALGAMVVMAKPYKQERLGHVVRLLAPPLRACEEAAPPRAPDPSRRAPAVASAAKNAAPGANRRFPLGRKS